MKRPISPWGAFVMVVLSPLWASAAQYEPVTDARLANPEPENWLMYRGTYDSHGFSPLKRINTRNVKRLKPLWTYSTGLREGHQAPPIVNSGNMFITTPHNHLLALDAENGDLIWRYIRELPEDQVQMHPTNRGVGLYGNLVFMATADCYVVALNAETGEVVWETEVEDYATGYYMTLAPLVAGGKVMVGVSGGEFGIRGFVMALDANTGQEAWKTYTIPAPGEPGSETWPGESWKTGGVPVWITGSFDTHTGLAYWGTGNGGPWMGDTRDGDNLYATSVIALDVATGEIRGHHQYHWNDSWDWDEVSAPLLIDFDREGQTVRGLVHPGRNGYLWFLERRDDGIGFIDAWPYVHQDVFTSIDPDSGRPTYDETKKPGTGKGALFCPSHWGGKDWPPAAFSPQTRLLYIPANDNVCAYMIGEEVTYRRGREFMGTDWQESTLVLTDKASEYIGELQAWNVDTGQKVWSTTFASHNWGPVLATAGDLVFMGGTNDRYFRAFHAKTGRVLWEQRTNSGVTGVPTTYEVNGKQYIAVLSGWGVDAQRESASLAEIGKLDPVVPQGGVLWVFGLE
ncbi:MAG: PQQ-dependent dehydrogenase, methanol/ethanol family [Gammaproteobacteria bacterium]|nr:PQQ-dependent dehydrogenase, methanol/ethanol family [Gammaproteobacteria bacterium]